MRPLTTATPVKSPVGSRGLMAAMALTVVDITWIVVDGNIHCSCTLTPPILATREQDPTPAFLKWVV